MKRPVRKAPTVSEDSLCFNIAAWLELALRDTGVAWTHFPAGEKRHPKVGAKLKKMGLFPGWPDYQFLIPIRNGCQITARFVGIEIKKQDGRQTGIQKEVETEITEAGGYYHIARSLREVAIILETHGVKLRARAV